MNDNKSNSKKVLGLLAFVALMVVYGLNIFVLKGDSVYEERFSVSSGETIPITLTDTTKTYTLDVYTSRETSLTWTLTAPDGSEIESATELGSRKGHRLSKFRAAAAGTYQLVIGRRALAGRSRGTGRVEVLVDDKRFLPSFLLFW